MSTKSSATDMVTEVDRAAEALIVAALRAARPDDGIVGEEGADVAGTRGVRWLIDPIDGTTNFLYGLPGWGVSIAAADDDGPVAGVVAIPSLGELFSAARGHGARRDGEPLALQRQGRPGDGAGRHGFSYQPSDGPSRAWCWPRSSPACATSAASAPRPLDLCYVACGRLDAYYEAGSPPGTWPPARSSPARPVPP